MDVRKVILITMCVVLAIVCFIYGGIVLAVGSGTGFYIVWMGLGVLLIGMGGFIGFDVWGKLSIIVKTILIGGVSMGSVCFIIVEGCVISGFSSKGRENLDYIIVLGAQVHESGPSVVLRYRLDEAIKYLDNNPNTKCIVSGGKGNNEPYAEAVGMSKYLREHGIEGDRIIIEDKSLTTKQNIINSMKLMEQDAKVGIVTNDFHVFRAVQTAKKQGINNVCGIAAGSTRLYLPNNMLREFFGVLKFI